MKPTIYLHHDTYRNDRKHLKSVNNQHMSENYPQSSFGYFTFYQYFIERNGTLIQTRPEMDPTVVYKDAHKDSISICLAGHMDYQELTIMQRATLLNLFNELRLKYKLTTSNISEHRAYQNTSCPGKNIPKGYFQLLFISGQFPGTLGIIPRMLLRLRGIV